jgi:hypothetical protein
MSAPIAAGIQASKPVRGRELLPAELALESPEAGAPGDGLEAVWLGDEELVVGAGAEAVGAEGDGVEGDGVVAGECLPGVLPAKGSEYCSPPALWANAAAGTSRNSSQTASRRLVIQLYY